MAKGKPRWKDLPLEERVIKRVVRDGIMSEDRAIAAMERVKKKYSIGNNA